MPSGRLKVVLSQVVRESLARGSPDRADFILTAARRTFETYSDCSLPLDETRRLFHRVLRNVMIDEGRRRKRQAETSLQQVPETHPLLCTEDTTTTAVLHSERLDHARVVASVVREVLHEEDPISCLLYQARHLTDPPLPYAEIGEIAGLSEAAAKMRTRRATARIARHVIDRLSGSAPHTLAFFLGEDLTGEVG